MIQRKPGALRNGAPFADLPEAFKQLQQHLLKHPGGDREMVEILALVLHHDEQAVLCAVELALNDGAPTKTHILNLLHRLIDGKSPITSTVEPPQALTLNQEPRADVERYDALRNEKRRRRRAMRHDPASAAIVIMLRSLKMYGMAQAVGRTHGARIAGIRSGCPHHLSTAESRNRRTRGPLDRLPDQGGALPRLQGSDRIRLCLKRGQ